MFYCFLSDEKAFFLSCFPPDCLIPFILRIILICNYLICIRLCLVWLVAGEYFYNSKLFFIILKHSAMNTIEKKSVNVGNYISRSEMDAITTAYKQDRWAENSD